VKVGFDFLSFLFVTYGFNDFSVKRENLNLGRFNLSHAELIVSRISFLL
jgi:hypothetical protein